MAQDLGFQEILVIHGAAGAPPAPGTILPEATAPALEPDVEEARVLLRFGDRVEIRAGAREAAGVRAPAARMPVVSDASLEGLTETERFGVEAMRLRSDPGYKPVRPREGDGGTCPVARARPRRHCWRLAPRLSLITLRVQAPEGRDASR